MSNVINISTFEPEGSIGLLLHPNSHFTFKSILGPLYSMSNGMFFLNSESFKISWLNEPLSSDRYKVIRRNKKRNIPNYWEIVKLLLTDRILQDKKLLIQLAETLPNDIEDVTFNPIVKIKRGVLTEVLKNDKLYIYGLIMSRLVQYIVKYLRGSEVEDYSKLKDEEYKALVLDTKKYIWNDVAERCKGNILSVINDDVDNEALNKVFMSTIKFK